MLDVFLSTFIFIRGKVINSNAIASGGSCCYTIDNTELPSHGGQTLESHGLGISLTQHLASIST
jgi:hypothetical protein